MNRATRVTYGFAAALLVACSLVVSACQGAGDRAVAPGNAARSDAAPAPVTLRIKPGGVYHLNGDRTPVAADELKPRLARFASSAGQGERVLRVLGEKGVVGYDVVVALQAAREAGFQRAEGIADYVEGGSAAANFKRWSQDLEEVPVAPAASPDTASHP